MSCYAVVPARAGSNRILSKNIKELNGYPLIYYTIKTAIEADIFDEVYVNSDSETILDISRMYGASPYRRPEELGSGSVFVIDVVKDMLSSFTNDDYVAVLLPTCPLRSSSDLRDAYRLFEDNGYSIPVASVTDFDTPIQLAQFINDSGRLEPFFKEDYRKSTRSVGHSSFYRFNEAVVIDSVAGFYEHSNLIGDNPIPYYMPPERSLMIDYMYQFDLVEAILKNASK
jgi:CMP-N,N'-diacetyllegionaminic acid synthase